MRCEYCNQQGYILMAEVIKNHEIIYICDECDTVWTGGIVDDDHVTSFQVYAEDRGIKPLWDEIRIINDYRNK